MNDKTWRVLRELGLTQFEFQVYAVLLARGPMPYKIISKEAEIPQTRTLGILRNLEDKGWIESDKENPAKYYPKSPSNALELIGKSEDKFNILNDNIQEVENVQYFSRNNQVKEDQKFSIINGEYNILIKTRELLSTSRKEVMIAVPNSLNEIIELLIPTLAIVKNRGVRINLIINQGVNMNIINKFPYFSQLRIRENIPSGYLVRDSKEVLILLDKDDNEVHNIAIYSIHLGFVRLVLDNFSYLWKDSRALV